MYLHQYQTFEEAHARLQTFLDDVYHAKRLHSSLDYVPPDEFELKYPMCERLGGLDFLGALQRFYFVKTTGTLRSVQGAWRAATGQSHRLIQPSRRL